MLASTPQKSTSELLAGKSYCLTNGFNLPLQTKAFQSAQKPTQQSARRARARHKKRKGSAVNAAKKPLNEQLTIQIGDIELYDKYTTNPRKKARKFVGCRN
jgi:mannose/fructose-specific phosphotransferase system component IIA